jgi:hypothetical protein
MKKSLRKMNCLAFLLLVSIVSNAQSTLRSWKWARRPDIEIAPWTYPAISTDLNGNTYVAGSFVGTATFPTSPTPTTFTSAGENDIFVAKYDVSGNVVWAQRFGGIHGDGANAIKYDGFGNVYVVGSYVESTDFNGTLLSNPIAGTTDVYIAKISAATGSVIWVRQGAGSNSFYYDFNSRAALDVAVDSNGNPYITGNFTGNITFSPLATLSTGWWDIYVVKYSAAGAAQWAVQAGSPEAGYSSESGKGIAVDQSGNVYITGVLNGTSAYPTMFGSIPVVSGGGGGFYESDFFIAKYNQSTANWEWVRNGGGSGNDYGNKISLDAAGDAYVNGFYEGTATFGPSILTSVGGNDYFIAKYLSNGNLSWIHSTEGVGYFGGSSSKVDANGNFYFGGTFDGTITVGTETFTSSGYDNSYIASWNSGGNFQWAKQIPGTYYSHLHSLDLGADGEINIASVFAGDQTFDCTTLTSTSFTSMAIAKLANSSGGPQSPSVAASANPICTGASTTLSITHGSLNNATEWKWYSGSCGGTLAGTGTSITVSPTANTTYYVRGEGGCSGPGDCTSIAININNTAPAVTSVSAPVAPVPINTSVNLSVSSLDTDLASASINWGDGSIVQAVSNPSNTFVTPHTYTTPGVYTVSVTLTDVCGLSSSTFQYQYIVVYDSNGGFVTGGGWINSPAGAYRSDITVMGKAIFGFESKYQQGATIPTGNTEFKFQTANMNFKSSNYEWLVVSGSRAQFKGNGKINGAGSYGFLLTAVDGDLANQATPDLFRIKIWDKNNNDAIVYDNQYGAADNSTLATQIGGGSIMIHSIKPGQYTSSDRSRLNEQTSVELNVIVSPNPSVNQFLVNINGGAASVLTLKVFDVLGRVIEQENDVHANSPLIIGEKYKPGVYIIEVVQGNLRQTFKIVKQ